MGPIVQAREMLRQMGYRKFEGPLARRGYRLLAAHAIYKGQETRFDGKVFDRPDMHFFLVGSLMEDMALALKAINQEVIESRRVLEHLQNDVAALADIVLPALVAQTRAIRDARMTAVAEVQTTLAALREARTFFQQPQFTDDLHRMEAFVAACRELHALEAAGILQRIVRAVGSP